MPGTRSQLLDDILAWCLANTSSFMWIHGQPGAGKSSIAASLAQRLGQSRSLGASFFCKRDDAELNDPQRVIPTLVHQLALKHKAFGATVARSISNDESCAPIKEDAVFDTMVADPLRAFEKPSSTDGLVLIIDALDECSTPADSKRLLSRLARLSTLNLWLKVIVTSRNLAHIQTAFQKELGPAAISTRDLSDERPSDDILQVARSHLQGAAQDDEPDWPGEQNLQKLVEYADGLFIWITVACHYLDEAIGKQSKNERLARLLSRHQDTDSSRKLGHLYEVALSQCTGAGGDNEEMLRRILGAIVVAPVPLPEACLAALLSGRVPVDTLRAFLGRLGSVLYVDRTKSNTVRVCHTSFREFIIDSGHCSRRFLIDRPLHDAHMAVACLRTMSENLRFNMCSLESSYVMNADIPDLESRVDHALSNDLQYSCLYWMRHIEGVPWDHANCYLMVDGLREFFLHPSVLYWIEAMSLMKQLVSATSTIESASNWLQVRRVRAMRFCRSTHL